VARTVEPAGNAAFATNRRPSSKVIVLRGGGKPAVAKETIKQATTIWHSGKASVTTVGKPAVAKETIKQAATIWHPGKVIVLRGGAGIPAVAKAYIKLARTSAHPAVQSLTKGFLHPAAPTLAPVMRTLVRQVSNRWQPGFVKLYLGVIPAMPPPPSVPAFFGISHEEVKRKRRSRGRIVAVLEMLCDDDE
jgi:hypothetical protein